MKEMQFHLPAGLFFCHFSAPPDITHISDNQTMIENDNMTLNCTADGHPPPSITWTRLSDNSVVTFPLTTRRQDQGVYRCTANNSIGSPATNDVFITVLCKCWNVIDPNINIETIRTD